MRQLKREWRQSFSTSLSKDIAEKFHRAEKIRQEKQTAYQNQLLNTTLKKINSRVNSARKLEDIVEKTKKRESELKYLE